MLVAVALEVLVAVVLRPVWTGLLQQEQQQQQQQQEQEQEQEQEPWPQRVRQRPALGPTSSL